MGRDTKRIFSIGRAKESADAAAGDPAGGRGDDDEAPRATGSEPANGSPGGAELFRVIDIGEPAAGTIEEEVDEVAVTRQIDPATLKPKPVSLPRQEKPLLLTREIPSSPHRSTGPLGTIRVSAIEMASEYGSGDAEEASPSSAPRARTARRCAVCGTQFSAPEVRFCPFDGSPMDDVPDWDPSGDPLIGHTLLDRFIVESVLAEGSMGTVYRVRHRRLDARFAMKVLRRDLAREQEVASRLIDEARATAAIGHPNIVAVSDFGEITATELPDLGELTLPFFVMELLEGSSLAEVIRAEGPLEAGRIARIMSQCASALAAAHAANIVHRDLKPANIRLSRSELGEEMVKVVDFGVSKIMGLSRKTRPGIVFGTPHYMSPEQGKGLDIDHRTDIYALGVIMYECVSGAVPFEADTYMGVVTKHLFTRPEPIEFPPADPCGCALELIIMRCLAKDRRDRYGAMSEVANDLDRAVRGELPVDSPTARAMGLKLREQEAAPGSRTGRPSLEGEIPVRPVPGGLVVAVVAIVAVAAVTVALSVGGLLPLGPSEAPRAKPDGTDPAETALESTHRGQEPTAPALLDEADAAAEAVLAEPSAGRAQPSGPPIVPQSASTASQTDPPVTAPAPAPPPPAAPAPAKPARPGGDVVDPWSK